MKSKVIYFELPAENMSRAKKFYSATFGWEMKDMGEDYTSVLCAESSEYMHSDEIGAITGGIQKKGERAVAPTVVIEVEDIDQVIASLEKAGGKIIVPKDEMGCMGWYAQFNDSEGNRIGLFQPAA